MSSTQYHRTGRTVTPYRAAVEIDFSGRWESAFCLPLDFQSRRAPFHSSSRPRSRIDTPPTSIRRLPTNLPVGDTIVRKCIRRASSSNQSSIQSVPSLTIPSEASKRRHYRDQLLAPEEGSERLSREGSHAAEVLSCSWLSWLPFSKMTTKIVKDTTTLLIAEYRSISKDCENPIQIKLVFRAS